MHAILQAAETITIVLICNLVLITLIKSYDRFYKVKMQSDVIVFKTWAQTFTVALMQLWDVIVGKHYDLQSRN